MQKFNLGEVVQPKRGLTKPGVIINISTGIKFYSENPGLIEEWQSHVPNDEYDLKEFPVYMIEYPKEVKLYSFDEFCIKYGVEPTDDMEKIYSMNVPRFFRCSCPEINLELLAYSQKEWMDSFESKQDLIDFLETY